MQPTVLIGITIALATTPAIAADYVVVRSEVPTLTLGQQFEAGAVVNIPAGKSVTLMHASGSIEVLRGTGSATWLPKHVATNVEAGRLSRIVVVLLSKPPESKEFAALRTTELASSPNGTGPQCAAPLVGPTLVTLDEIASTADRGCEAQAKEGFERYLQTRLLPPQH